MKPRWRERNSLLGLLVPTLGLASLLLAKKLRDDPLEIGIISYVGEDAVDCGTIDEHQKPDTEAIAGCVGEARKKGRAFWVRRNLVHFVEGMPTVAQGRWTTAIAGLPDGTARTFYIERKRWGDTIVYWNDATGKQFQWTLDLDEVRGHQLKFEF
ncbi:MAG TPA: hypothetical protein VF681_00975 [Abditibacteriaceae bacterium]